MPSPYSEKIAFLLREINIAFTKEMNLLTPYKREDILPGERYGIITFRSLGPDNDRGTSSSKVRTGGEFKVFTVEMLLTLGCADEQVLVDRIGTEATGTAAMLDLEHGISAIKDALPGDLIYDFELTGEIVQVLRQSILAPHTFMVDVTASAIARLVVFKDKHGKHILIGDRAFTP